jgi:integrase
MAGNIRPRGSSRPRIDGTRDDSWEVTVDLGRSDGKRQRKRFTVRGSYEDAQLAMAKALYERANGIDINPKKITVADLLLRWRRDYAEQNVARSTLQRYDSIIEQHLIPGRFSDDDDRTLGSLLLRDLRPAQIQAVYGAFKRRDGRAGKLSPKTVREHHAVLREALDWAVRMQLIDRNPATVVSPPRVERNEMQVLDREQVQRLLEAADPSPHFTAIFMAWATAARIGELMALRWQDIDLNGGVMRIARSARFYKGEGIVYGPCKTHRSRRPLALSRETVRVVQEHRRRQLEQRLEAGPVYKDEDLVFANDIGGPTYGSTVRRAFYAIVKKAGLPRLRFHDLRHTAATLMLAEEIPAHVVSQKLGHVKVGFTLDTYGHVLPDQQREAAERMDAILVRKWSANGG